MAGLSKKLLARFTQDEESDCDAVPGDECRLYLAVDLLGDLDPDFGVVFEGDFAGDLGFGNILDGERFIAAEFSVKGILVLFI